MHLTLEAPRKKAEDEQVCLSCRDASEAIKQLRKPILLASQSHDVVMIILAMGLISIIIIIIISVRTSGSSTQASPSSSTSASSSQTRGGPLPAGNLPPSLPPTAPSVGLQQGAHLFIIGLQYTHYTGSHGTLQLNMMSKVGFCNREDTSTGPLRSTATPLHVMPCLLT